MHEECSQWGRKRLSQLRGEAKQVLVWHPGQTAPLFHTPGTTDEPQNMQQRSYWFLGGQEQDKQALQGPRLLIRSHVPPCWPLRSCYRWALTEGQDNSWESLWEKA